MHNSETMGLLFLNQFLRRPPKASTSISTSTDYEEYNVTDTMIANQIFVPAIPIRALEDETLAVAPYRRRWIRIPFLQRSISSSQPTPIAQATIVESSQFPSNNVVSSGFESSDVAFVVTDLHSSLRESEPPTPMPMPVSTPASLTSAALPLLENSESRVSTNEAFAYPPPIPLPSLQSTSTLMALQVGMVTEGDHIQDISHAVREDIGAFALEESCSHADSYSRLSNSEISAIDITNLLLQGNVGVGYIEDIDARTASFSSTSLYHEDLAAEQQHQQAGLQRVGESFKQRKGSFKGLSECDYVEDQDFAAFLLHLEHQHEQAIKSQQQDLQDRKAIVRSLLKKEDSTLSFSSDCSDYAKLMYEQYEALHQSRFRSVYS